VTDLKVTPNHPLTIASFSDSAGSYRAVPYVSVDGCTCVPVMFPQLLDTFDIHLKTPAGAMWVLLKASEAKVKELVYLPPDENPVLNPGGRTLVSALAASRDASVTRSESGGAGPEKVATEAEAEAVVVVAAVGGEVSKTELPVVDEREEAVSKTELPVVDEREEAVSKTELPVVDEREEAVSKTELPVVGEKEEAVSKTELPVVDEREEAVSKTELPVVGEKEEAVSSRLVRSHSWRRRLLIRGKQTGASHTRDAGEFHAQLPHGARLGRRRTRGCPTAETQEEEEGLKVEGGDGGGGCVGRAERGIGGSSQRRGRATCSRERGPNDRGGGGGEAGCRQSSQSSQEEGAAESLQGGE